MKNKIIIIVVVAVISIILGVVLIIFNNESDQPEEEKYDKVLVEAVDIIDLEDKGYKEFTYIETNDLGHVILEDRDNNTYDVDMKKKTYIIKRHHEISALKEPE